ncbi:ABC transporter permease [Actinomyces vulturis]|uniref:ABC transporter permease n=1 Tax=Actinomyces vulturis TaxID=1857645 RepID=UPI00082A652B|nr:ABC transporter permease [Actinomyces vulturis]
MTTPNSSKSTMRATRAVDAATTVEQEKPSLAYRLLSGSWLVSVLAVFVALLVGAVLIIMSDSDVQRTATYFFARPTDFFSAAWNAVSGAYLAMLRGSILDWKATSTVRMIRPLTETLTNSVPLILAGLGVAVGFRAGLFNIGAQGQVILGAIFGSYVGFAFNLPIGLHLLVAVVAAGIGGALWAGIAGVLKAKTGANEVIVTIMLNSIAALLIAYVLTLSPVIGQGNTNPKSRHVLDSAAYPLLLGAPFRIHAGFIVALLAAAAVWWLLERSTLGFEFRATGMNPEAAQTAGISVAKVTILVMLVSGFLCGLAGSAPVLGTERYLTSGVAASYGFDAITVALLGKSRPGGTVLAGLLFGALNAGGTLMQTATQTPIDIVLVIQSTIVLFIAAPPLVRAMFHLPEPGKKSKNKKKRKSRAQVAEGVARQEAQV